MTYFLFAFRLWR